MSHVVFSYSNICKHLGIDKEDIKFLTICMNTCVVTLKTGERIKVKAEELKPIMENDRIERSKAITITSLHDGYKATNGDKNTVHYLQAYEDGIECTCDDYKNQSIFFDSHEVLCRHGYALLNYLGCHSLNLTEYQKMVAYNLAQYERIQERDEMMSYAWYDDSKHW